MRFEIRSGGVVAILLGVAALSFAVFMLGLLAGYDVGRESQSSAAQVATAYPVDASARRRPHLRRKPRQRPAMLPQPRPSPRRPLKLRYHR